MYWSPCEILPYQRVFNFINAPRGIGKTYSMLKWLIGRGLAGKQFVYIVRTQKEKESGVLQAALQKVLDREYPELEPIFSNDFGLVDNRCFVMCLALSEAIQIKKRSFPDVHYIVFDEYTIEDGTGRYVNGFQEPELFINIYHTIDREENRVKCFFMGNNTSYYNPYHLYPLFGLPGDIKSVPDGSIWKNDISLIQRAVPSEELIKKKAKNKFLTAAKKTRYGEYAVNGEYRDDTYQPIRKLINSDIYRATVHTPGGVFGCYTNPGTRTLTFSDKVDNRYGHRFSLSREGYKEGYCYILPRYQEFKKLFNYAFSLEQLFYTSMSVKARVEPYLIKLL